MNDLLNRSWNKGNDEVKRAKALAAYNMGPTRLVNILNEMKQDGYDIYESTLWINDLPKYHKYKSGSKLDDYKPEDPKSGNGSSGAPAALYM